MNSFTTVPVTDAFANRVMDLIASLEDRIVTFLQSDVTTPELSFMAEQALVNLLAHEILRRIVLEKEKQGWDNDTCIQAFQNRLSGMQDKIEHCAVHQMEARGAVKPAKKSKKQKDKGHH